MKMQPVVAELFHAGGWTDRQDGTNNGFSQYCERACNSMQDVFDLQFHQWNSDMQ